MLNDGKYEYRYDDEGNLTQKKELLTGNLTNYEWDYRNRLMKVVSGSQIVEYGYDAEDKRVSKKLNGVTTEKYVYDGADIALVLNAAGTLVERYLYGDGTDNVLSRERSGAVVWSLGDRQGSVVDLVSENGVVLNHFVYDGFGTRTGTTAVDFRYGYTGRELDTETGLYYYRARYYDSKVGRFISEDPIGFSAGDTNLYRYVGNNSTNYTDPSGMLWANLGAGLLNVGIDAVLQLATKGEIDDFGSLGVSFATGFIGYGLADKAGKLLSASRSVGQVATKYKYATSIATNAFVDGGVGATVKVGTNVLTDQNWSDNVWETATNQALFGAVGNAVTRSTGAAWNKYTRLDRVGRQLDDLAAETKATIGAIEDWQVESGNIPGLHPKSPSYKVGEISIAGTGLPYKGNIYNPLANQGDVDLDRLIVSGRLSGNAINLEGAIRLNTVRQEAAQSLGTSASRGLANGRSGNAAFADVWINNKHGATPDFTLRGISGESNNIRGFVRYTPSENRVLQTKIIKGVDRAQDPDAKILEEILANTNIHDKIRINFYTERPVCESCIDVIANFLAARPNAKISTFGSVIK